MKQQIITLFFTILACLPLQAEIIAVEESIAFDEVIKIFVEGAHSRIPIYHEQLDNITGMLHIKDLVKYQTENDIKSNFIDSGSQHLPMSKPEDRF